MKMTTYSDFAELINRYLEQRDRNLSWLARRLGINHSTVSRWLNQDTRPADPETVIRIADVLGVHDPKERQLLLIAAGFGYIEAEPSEAAPRSAEFIQDSPPQTVPATDALSRDTGTSTAPTAPPYMIPPLPPHGVLGRDEMLASLHELLHLGDPSAANVPPAALHGMGGVGKTTLAIALGRRANTAQLFPDGVLWATVGPSPTIRNLLNDWGHAIGENLAGERDAEACKMRLRSALFHRRIMAIVDDVWEATHGQAFVVTGPLGRTLFTTRESPAAFALTTRERTLRVDVLPAEAAMALLSRLVPEAMRIDEHSALRLCERLEFLPLALTLAGRLLAQEADVPKRMKRLLDELLERRATRLNLAGAEGRPGLGEGQPASLHAILGLSVARLNRVEQERFAILSAFGGEPLTWELGAAAFLWQCSEDEAEVTISHLIQRGLVMRRGEQYWMHALLADYAAEMLAGAG
jgi:transcriptional regulator with XRE-family HTH domain